jgi:amidase
MQRISWEQSSERCYVIGPYRQPVATVSPGETFQIETLDAFGNRVTGPDTPPTKVLSLPYVNPVTGPIYVDGAEKGDTLAVTIVEIKPAREFGVSATIPEFGGLCGTSLTRVLNDPLSERVWIHTITDDGIIYDPNLDIPKIPLEPFYGTMGTAPELEAISTLAPGWHGGNMDAPDVCPGNTIYFPVSVPGALLHVGDGHAAQGDGEVSGVAVEIPTTGTLKVDLVKGRSIASPRIENQEFIMAVGNARPMEDAARIAFYELVRWLTTEYEIDRLNAYQLCSQVAQVRLANMVDILYTIVAKFPRKYLPPRR